MQQLVVAKTRAINISVVQKILLTLENGSSKMYTAASIYESKIKNKN
jgi:hypothetical protein